MARPKNPAHRDALLAAATRVFAAEGLGASTASIAKAAGVSTGTLFVHFPTKTALVNELYIALKGEMGRTATAGFRADRSVRDQLRGMWDRWITWALEAPEKRRALAHLAVAEDLTDASRAAVHVDYAGIPELLAAATAGGPFATAELGFVLTLLSAISDATIDDLIRTPDPSGTRSGLAFDATWRAITG